MNYIKHLNRFLAKVYNDERLNPSHISLYLSLFQCWNSNRFRNPVSIARSEVMRISKLGARATYHKIIHQLHAFGYIIYQPSYNPFKGSTVTLIAFDEDEHEEVVGMNSSENGSSPGSEQVYERKHATIETSDEQGEGHYINNINNTDTVKNKTGGKQPVSPRRDEQKAALPAGLHEVIRYFEAQQATPVEAEKFFNYFESNGWKVGGRAPMKNWKAAARNWILNQTKFTHDTGKPSFAASVGPSTGKNFGEPL